MAKYELVYFQIGGVDVPVKRYYEKRRNVRISIGKSSILLRIPIFFSLKQRQKYHVWARNWIQLQIDQKAGSINHLLPIKYRSGSKLECMNNIFQLNIIHANRSSSTAKLNGNHIEIKLDDKLINRDKSDCIKKLISRVLAKRYQKEIEQRLRLINKHYFGHNVKNVRLKYNRTNWGSCSNNGNINISTRLLIAPDWVRDYVIVHELAHLNEMNHSSNFWAIVDKVYPKYKKAERWLKLHGSKCDFTPEVNK